MKARLIDVQLSFQIVADSGEFLYRVKVDPAFVSADKIDAMQAVVYSTLEQVQAQLDAQNATAPGDESGAG